MTLKFIQVCSMLVDFVLDDRWLQMSDAVFLDCGSNPLAKG